MANGMIDLFHAFAAQDADPVVEPLFVYRPNLVEQHLGCLAESGFTGWQKDLERIDPFRVPTCQSAFSA
jgi:hypothetical protein